MKDVLDRTDNTFLITEVISSTHNAFGPAAELVCGLAVGSACKTLAARELNLVGEFHTSVIASDLNILIFFILMNISKLIHLLYKKRPESER